MRQYVVTFETVGDPCRFDACPPGYFIFDGNVFLKSEYKTEASSGKWNSHAYCESGEYFWGGTSDSHERDKLIVQPVAIAKGKR